VDLETESIIECPYCGHRIELLIDTSAGPQQFTTDCEVCCRPVEVVVECAPGRILELRATVE
jgi:hypothetical protein